MSIASRRLGLLVLAFFILAQVASAFPRIYGNRGTATTSNATLTVPFNPSSVCVFNDGAAELYFAFASTATATDGGSNLVLKANESMCYNFNYDNVTNVFQVSVITAAATALYRVHAIQK